MMIDTTHFAQQIEQLTVAEHAALADTAELLLQTRDLRTARVDEYVRRLETADEITRFVVGQYLRTYCEVDRDMVLSGQCGWVESLVGFSHREKIGVIAPGVYWLNTDRVMYETLTQTGEFKTYHDFDEAAEALLFTGRKAEYRRTVPQALDTVDHLVHWLAARFPDSEAARIVADHGTKAGRLVHGSTRGFRSRGLLFHESVLEDYVERECIRRGGEYGPHRPIVALASTGDWDKATALCTPHKQKMLQQAN